MNNSTIKLSLENGKIIPEVNIVSNPWFDAFLLPSKRVSFLVLSDFLNEALKSVPKETIGYFAGIIEFLWRILKELPIIPALPLFLEDFIRASLGISEPYIKRYESPLGILEIVRSPLFWLVEYHVKDPLIPNIALPLKMAPEGAVDQLILSTVLENAPKNSIIIIEEPENNKNPTYLISLIKEIVSKSIENDLTIVMSTHSEIIPLSLSKNVEDGLIKPEDVRLYYLRRSEENPWTELKRINIYEDGSLDPLPDSEETTVNLF